MEQYLIRMLNELYELNGRIKNLNDFYIAGGFIERPREDMAVKDQLHAMRSYHKALATRIWLECNNLYTEACAEVKLESD